MQLSAPITVQEIMRRLMALNPSTCLRFRDKFPPDHPHIWHISLRRIVISHPTGGWCSALNNESGKTPEEAIQNTWESIIELFANNSKNFFLHYTCNNNVPIPGNTSQAWTRWNQSINNWEDVVPSEEALRAHQIPRSRIIPYQELNFRYCRR